MDFKHKFEGREPPLTSRQEKQYLYFGHLFPCTPGPFSLLYGTFSEEFPQSRPCTTRIWACTTGWRLALYLCSPSPALGLRVVAYLVNKCEHGFGLHCFHRVVEPFFVLGGPKPLPMQQDNCTVGLSTRMSLPESPRNSQGFGSLNLRGWGVGEPVEEAAIAADLNQNTYKQDENHAKPWNGDRGRPNLTLNGDPELCSKV